MIQNFFTNGTWYGFSFSNHSVLEYHGIMMHAQGDDHWFPPATEGILVGCYCLVILFGLLGNLLVCVVVYRNAQLRSPRNLLILNLSLCDIIMCVICMPFSLIRMTLKNWPLGEALCKIVPSLQTIDVFVSTFTIVGIAFDRYKAIVCVVRERRQRKPVVHVIIGIWVAAVVMALPMLMFHRVHTTDMVEYHVCVEDWPSDPFKGIYTTVIMVVQYMTPTLVITILHARICHFLRLRIEENPTTEAENNRALRYMRQHRRNLLLLTAIAVSFSITWLPLTILNVTADFDYKLFADKNFNLLYAVCLLIAMGSAGLNPLYYGWFNVNFKNAFFELLCQPDGESTQDRSSGSGNGSNAKTGFKYETFKVDSREGSIRQSN